MRALPNPKNQPSQKKQSLAPITLDDLLGLTADAEELAAEPEQTQPAQSQSRAVVTLDHYASNEPELAPEPDPENVLPDGDYAGEGYTEEPPLNEAEPDQTTDPERVNTRRWDMERDRAVALVSKHLIRVASARTEPGILFREDFIASVLDRFTSNSTLAGDVAASLIESTGDAGYLMFKADQGYIALLKAGALDAMYEVDETDLPDDTRGKSGEKVTARLTGVEHLILEDVALAAAKPGEEANKAGVLRTGMTLMAQLSNAGIDISGTPEEIMARLLASKKK